jgi:ribosomal protein L11 methylase PrmA
VGVDIDRDSLVSAQTNCLLNALDVKLYIADGGDSQSAEEQSVLLNRFKGANAQGVEFPSVDTLPREQQFDVVVANILGTILTIYNIYTKYKTYIYCILYTDTDYPISFILYAAPILISLAPELAAYNRRGGLLALSGVFESQSATVMQAFAPFYEQLQVSGKEEEWVLITGVRK